MNEKRFSPPADKQIILYINGYLCSINSTGLDADLFTLVNLGPASVSLTVKAQKIIDVKNLTIVFLQVVQIPLVRHLKQEGEAGKCQNWKVSELFFFSPNWKGPELESVSYRTVKCQNYSKLENVRIRMCHNFRDDII